MKTCLKVLAASFIGLGLCLLRLPRPNPPVDPFPTGGPITVANNAKGAFATVASSGHFWQWGLVLVFIGVVVLLIQLPFKE